MNSATNRRRFATAVTLLLMALVPCARAQSTDDDGERRTECRRGSASERRRCENEIGAPGSLATVLDGTGRPAQLYGTSLPLGRIEEDLDYLRDAADYLSHTASRDGVLDLKAVEKIASEVRKRAGRLRNLLILPNRQKGEGQREKRDIGDTEHLREALSELSELVADAMRNPVLRGYMLDPAMSAEAWRDLDEIVELCDCIKTGSVTLVKTRR
ncbi:MAG: hypothetical protein ACJ74T_05645 [Pyrinomonadaceae bacterium]